MRGASSLQAAAWSTKDIVGHALLFLLVAGLTWAADQLEQMPPALEPYWLVAGLVVGASIRGRWLRVLPSAAVAMIAGNWLGGEAPGARNVIVMAITIGQAAVVAYGLRRSFRLMFTDRRPAYRVRLAQLAYFLFGLTLPASAASGLLVGLFDLIDGTPLSDATRIAFIHAAASGLSIALLTPLLWAEQLRAVSWRGAILAALAALAVVVLSHSDGPLFWFAPIVVMTAGYYGSTWTAIVTVVFLGGGLLVQGSVFAQSPFGGDHGFTTWLVVVWRLLTSGLIASLWSERRGRALRRAAGRASMFPTAAKLARKWRDFHAGHEHWHLVLLDEIVKPEEQQDLQSWRVPGTSLLARGALMTLATHFRAGDAVVGISGQGAVVLLRMDESGAGDPATLASRCKAATHEGVRIGHGHRLDARVIAVLLTSAVYLDSDLNMSTLSSLGPQPDEERPLELTSMTVHVGAGTGAMSTERA